MGVLEKLKDHRRQGVGGSAPTPPRPTPDDGRAQVRHCAGELAKAKNATNELQDSVDRLTAIIAHAEEADAALQAAVAADGGAALKSYSDGGASDQPIARLIAAQETSAKAAAAARPALEKARGMLDACRSEVTRLEKATDDAVIMYLKRRAADDAHSRYRGAFFKLSAHYDTLCGISVALSATDHAEIITTSLPLPFSVPDFNTRPGRGPSERADMRHAPNEAKVSEATAKWMEARERLRDDPEAQIDELIGPPLFQYEADRDL